MRTKSLLFLVPLFLFACGGTMGDIGDILGGGTNPSQRVDLRGEVVRVDTAARRIELNVDTVNNLNDQRNNSSVYYDDRTVVEFQGQTYRPEDLERGDEISIVGARQGSNFIAERIVVDRNVRDAGGYRPDDQQDNYANEVRGTVRLVDTRSRLVELDLAYGERGDNRFYYDDRTIVEFNGRQYGVESLERGDEIEVRGEIRSGRFLADTVRVTYDAASRR